MPQKRNKWELLSNRRFVSDARPALRAYVRAPQPERYAASDGHDRHCDIFSHMTEYHFTEYFENEVLRKRPYLKKEWCIRVVESPIREESQENNRFRFWGACPELDGRHLRVVTLQDKVTIHNAFPDRGFKP